MNVYQKTYQILKDLRDITIANPNTSIERKEEVETILGVYAHENEKEIFDDNGNNNGLS